MAFDTLPYIDLLMGDLGLKQDRKHGALEDVLSPYGPADYKGLVEEWMAKRSNTQE